ncbi:ATP-binding protein [Olsenella sp. Marseille-P4559]|uniref:ATP-binding protein n=1 Tax=Olsenella sp. Marseille-P4559 TaxID=2364795 RepID=UPI0013EF59C2|nr:ATP-binding protein [Olsenella sp. Marseille-P4559]
MATSSVGTGGWADVSGDDVTASAIADRACHHCALIKVAGRSHRPKDLPADKGRDG